MIKERDAKEAREKEEAAKARASELVKMIKERDAKIKELCSRPELG